MVWPIIVRKCYVWGIRQSMKARCGKGPLSTSNRVDRYGTDVSKCPRGATIVPRWAIPFQLYPTSRVRAVLEAA